MPLAAPARTTARVAGSRSGVPRPHLRDCEIGHDDHRRRKDIVLDVVRVPHVQRCGREEQRGYERSAAVSKPHREPVEQKNTSRARQDPERTAGRIDSAGVGEIEMGNLRERPDATGKPRPPEIHTDPREEHVEEEGRIQKIVRVQRSLPHGQGPGHDRDFIRVVDRGKAELEPNQPEDKRERADGDQRQYPSTRLRLASLGPGRAQKLRPCEM